MSTQQVSERASEGMEETVKGQLSFYKLSLLTYSVFIRYYYVNNQLIS